MLTTTNKFEFLGELEECDTEYSQLITIACLLFDIREILLNQQQNKEENCNFDKIKDLTND
jgi:hypothetical protein